MNTLITTIIIGISLSMDAFSLSLVYGSKNFKQHQKITLSIIVGIYHFIMPLLGSTVGFTINKLLFFNPNIFLSIIFIFIAIEMIISAMKKSEEKIYLNIIGFFFFGLSVSIDSFTTGIGLNVINTNSIQSSIIFSLISTLFTYAGLYLGNKLSQKYGNYSTIAGAILLLSLAITYLLK